jgi:hypothetical protein
MARNGFFTRPPNNPRSKMCPTLASSDFDLAPLKSVLTWNTQHAVVTMRNPSTPSDRSPKLRFLRPTDYVHDFYWTPQQAQGFQSASSKMRGRHQSATVKHRDDVLVLS